MKFVLDFDGVILKNYYVYHHMSNKSTQFLAKELHINYKIANYYQKKYLQTHGHTAKILSKLNNKSFHYNLEKYNDYVFNDNSIYEMLSYLTIDDVLYINDFLALKKKNNLDFLCFSNAHFHWINSVLTYVDIDSNDMFNECFTSDNNYMKPDTKSYKTVEKSLLDNDNFVFIDDNLQNINSATEWNTYHFKRHDDANTLKTFLN